MKTKTTTRAQQRKATKDLEAKLCLRAFMDVCRRIDKYPKRLQRRVLGAANAIYMP